ncbi:DsbA family oxidoreductase [Agrobacterium sp. DKPNP3]|uniref:DsbA family oxidoreductase n=1 Tax=Agrobacterium sp. DKPNP3 TaxID=3457323 RepID=UPI0040451096
MSIPVTITSDFICPWCLIGERRLLKAIEELAESPSVDLRWQPFELNPSMPADGMNRKIYRSMKFGSWERSRMLDAQTVAAAQGDDVAFDYDAIEKTPNTFQAHRLMRFAERFGLANALGNALLSAYFEHGRDVGDSATLSDIAVEQGLDRDGVAAFLASDEESDEIRQIEQALQVSGVPNFNIDGEVISGAQPMQVFEEALRRAAERATRNTQMNGECAGGVCTVA